MTDILLVGSGGREHALARALAASPRAGWIGVAPGNGGTATLAGVENVPVSATDLDGLLHVARERRVDLVVVGPEAPLAAGLADRCAEAGIACFGPKAAAARLEASKAWSKAFMDRWNIPTARWGRFEDPEAAIAWIQAADFPVVVKASGLAAGKGVIVPADAAEAVAAVRELADTGAGATLVVEERLTGPEVSVLAFCDGAHLAVMPPAQDHKAVGDGDTGPNTGGMGAYAPAPLLDAEGLATIVRDVLAPAVAGMAAEGTPYVGVLYAGMMLTPDGPRTLEFNARFGDPETQVLLPLLASDLVDVLEACVAGTLDPDAVRWHPGAAATVVAAAAGYPGSYAKGMTLEGVPEAEALDGVQVVHAGTRREGDRLLTDGGRVLSVTGTGANLREALGRAYAGLAKIHFEGKFHRSDIGARALVRGG